MALLDHEIPTVFKINTLSSGIMDTASTVIYHDTLSGTEDILVEIPLVTPGSYLINLALELILSNYTGSGIFNIIDEFNTATTDYDFVDTDIDLWLLNINSTVENIDTDLFFYSDLRPFSIDSRVSFRINIGSIPTKRDIFNELYLCEAKYFNLNTDIYCATSGTLWTIESDIKQQPGRITPITSDIYSVTSGTMNISDDIFCSVLTTSSVTTDLITISGTIAVVKDDIYVAGVSSLVGPKIDIKTRSIFIDGFFLGVDDFTTASAIGHVDIIDYVYPILEDRTYIQKDGITISGTYFEDISNGKRLIFDPLDDFYSPGEVILSVHAESSIGEILDEDFFLLYGYDIELNEVVHWKPTQEIIVRAEASNIGFCPNSEGVTYSFSTRDYYSYNLPVSIRPVDSVDLPVNIYPQSTAFFYGKTYSVRVDGVKDYSGNTMAPFTYTFTIEDPSD